MADKHIDPEIALISETTGLEADQIETLIKGFEGFDKEGTDTISETSMQMILKSMGVKSEKEDFQNAATVVDEAGTGQFSLPQFCSIAATFMIEDDDERMKEELKEAFKIYDKEGNGFITIEGFKDLISEIDPSLSSQDIDGIINEVDEDGTGILDFENFQEMMMG
eukprot:GFUD01040756.1.p1 GENE.GFUD01040756.1~~GFUD01040756.1.p1  ORF type:complete len:166 (-),score=56.87 GFUD01040756.1:41-538(-)